jgi:hypothetical protein
MKRLLLFLILTTPYVFAEENLNQPISPSEVGQVQVVNPNDPNVKKSINSLIEPLPLPDVRESEIDENSIKAVNTKPNFWTVIKLPFNDFEFEVGNPAIYEVKKKENTFMVRPLKQYQNSDITIFRGNKIYKILLTQTTDTVDSIVILKERQPVNYQAELEKVLKGEKSPYVQVERYTLNRKYDKVIVINGEKLGVIFR